MKTLISILLSMTLAFSGGAAAQQIQECNETTDVETAAGGVPADIGMTSARTDQVIYKGVVGNLLESVPLDPVRRVELQRTNAVISNPLTGRSLAVILGVASPLLMIGGLLWGIWAATQIETAVADVNDKPLPPSPVATETNVLVALE